jgi:hypothetical protein
MEMQGEQIIPAPRDQVWEALNDPEVLRQCIPGCESLEKTAEDKFEAAVTAKVGPVKAKFKGEVELSDIDPPNGYTLSGSGSGGAAGFGKGSAKVRLEDVPDGTKLTYDVTASVGGKLAQIGSRLVDGAARKMADDFFSNFKDAVSGPAPETTGAATPEAADEAAPAEAHKLPKATWWLLGAVVLLVVIYLLAS